MKRMKEEERKGKEVVRRGRADSEKGGEKGGVVGMGPDERGTQGEGET